MKLNNIDYHICDTCNLKCASCNHFSSLSKDPKFINTIKAKQDFDLLKTIDDKFKKITILGGEALLNPDLIPIMELAVQYFPGRVKLITNGILTEPLYTLKKCAIFPEIELVITEYPFKNDFREHYDKLKHDFPNAVFYTFRHEHGFISDHLSYDKTNASDELLLNCEKRFKCVQFRDGKLYICHYAAYLNNLETITRITFDNKDSYIEINKCSDKEFDEFFTANIPEICRHCKFVQKPYEDLAKKPWSRTKNDPQEWIS